MGTPQRPQGRVRSHAVSIVTGGRAFTPSPRSGGEGRAAPAAKGEGTDLRSPSRLSSPSPRSPRIGSGVSRPLPLKGVRGFGIAIERDEDMPQYAVEVG